MKFLILLCLTTLGLLSCDFRRPDDGYDPDWQPDHEAPAAEQGSNDSTTTTDRLGAADYEQPADNAEPRRPSEIAADTSQMAKTSGTWEMVGMEKSEYIAYWNRDIEMIVEKFPKYTAAYYFNQGALFYYHEESHDGSAQLTVEFDDIGDILGARKTIDGEPVHANVEDYGDIVEHAVELKIAAEN